MARYIRSESVVSRVIAGETLIVPVRRGVGDLASIYSLNAVASVIWQSVGGPRSVEEIVGALKAEFAADNEELERDVNVFLQEMSSAGLIHQVEAAA